MENEAGINVSDVAVKAVHNIDRPLSIVVNWRDWELVSSPRKLQLYPFIIYKQSSVLRRVCYENIVFDIKENDTYWIVFDSHISRWFKNSFISRKRLFFSISNYRELLLTFSDFAAVRPLRYFPYNDVC